MPEEEISFNNLKEFLLLLCHYPYEEANKEALSTLISEVRDWNWMVNLINAHGIIALAAYNIREAGLEKDVPPNVMRILDYGRMQSILRNTWLTERWKEVNIILTNAGIKHILLKGMALEYTLYGAKGLRQMTDNDILIKPEDSLIAWHLLQKEGFDAGLIKSPLHKRIIYNVGKHLPCLYKNGYAIEIHYKMYDTDITKEKSLIDTIDNALEIHIGDTKAWILPNRIQLLYLIDHFTKHALEGEQQLRLYADILMLDKTNTLEIPDNFILNPLQCFKPKYLKSNYKTTINSIPAKLRLRYIIGDIFPTLKWMKQRHRCSWVRAFFYYPQRLGKLVWLL